MLPLVQVVLRTPVNRLTLGAYLRIKVSDPKAHSQGHSATETTHHAPGNDWPHGPLSGYHPSADRQPLVTDGCPSICLEYEKSNPGLIRQQDHQVHFHPLGESFHVVYGDVPLSPFY